MNFEPIFGQEARSIWLDKNKERINDAYRTGGSNQDLINSLYRRTLKEPYGIYLIRKQGFMFGLTRETPANSAGRLMVRFLINGNYLILRFTPTVNVSYNLFQTPIFQSMLTSGFRSSRTLSMEISQNCWKQYMSFLIW